MVRAIDHLPGGCQHVTRAANVRRPAGWLRWRLSRWLDLDGAKASPTRGGQAIGTAPTSSGATASSAAVRAAALGAAGGYEPGGRSHASAPYGRRRAALIVKRANTPAGEPGPTMPTQPAARGPAGHGADLVLRSSHRRCDRGELVKCVFASESLHGELGDPSAHIADSAD